MAGVDTHPPRHVVHPITAPSPNTPCGPAPEDGILDTLRELGIGFVAYSPLGHGFLTGTVRLPEQFDADEFRATTRGSPARTSSATYASSTRSRPKPTRAPPPGPGPPSPGC
jgi:aryl-alcohol dehydrogenase-like predicted oxidoreductase